MENKGYINNVEEGQPYSQQQYPQQPPQQYPPPPQWGYYPPPQRSDKWIIITVIAVVLVVIIAFLAILFINPFGGHHVSGYGGKTMWDVVKGYDTNHDGIISVNEITHADLPDYNPGDMIHIKDIISVVDGVHTFTADEINGFYRDYITDPYMDLKPGDTYTYFELHSVLIHAHDNITYALSMVAIPGNLTTKYHAGDTIEFTTEVYKLTSLNQGSGSQIDGEFTGAFIVVYFVPVMGSGGNTPLSMALSYIPSQSNNTKATFEVSMANPTSADYTKVYISITDTSNVAGSYLDSSGTATIYLGSAKYTVRILDMDGNNMISSGDEIVIDGGSNSVSGLTISISITGYSGTARTTVPS